MYLPKGDEKWVVHDIEMRRVLVSINKYCCSDWHRKAASIKYNTG